MKKILVLIAAMIMPPLVFADASVNTPYGPYIGVDGGTLRNGSAIQVGQNPKDQACSSLILATAAAAIAIGDAVVWNGTAGPISVNKTTTEADPLFLGIAMSATTGSGQVIQVCTEGIVRANVAGSATTTLGQKLITSATGGKLESVTLVAEANYTGLSGTAIAAQAAEAKTYNSATPYVIVRILGR